ncbi:MAG: DotA/TraY family protein [Rhizobiaceae bacterium]|jgi:conjugal transfer/type IV secretion protein DotA/TraY|nr:DotA/TraY family protein [Rhizobiaceae bacterium]
MDKSNQSRTINSKINGKAIARYAMLPGIIPRIRGLGFHFGHFAYLIAMVLSSARLIPLGHSVCNASNIGRYGVRQVLAVAANNIQWSWKNTDQIAVFCAVAIGLVLIVLQVITIAALALVEPASAQADPASFFETPNEDQDLAFIFLSQVFGTELELFGAGGIDSEGNPLFGTTGNPLHVALRTMLSIYSMATMVIAVIIVLYYILTVIGEAAKTGTPFGQRFNALWAPIRLVVALGLLVPLASGLNSAQYITLWMAKQGSGLGSQIWSRLADQIKEAPETLYNIKLSEPLFLQNMVENAFIASVCAKAHTEHEAEGGSGEEWTRLLMSGDSENSFVYDWRGPDSAPHHRRSCGAVSVSFPDGQERVGLGTNIFGIPERESPLPTGKLLTTVRPVIDRALGEVDAVAATYDGGLKDEETINKLKEIAEEYSKELTDSVSDLYTSETNANLKNLLQGVDDKGWLYAGIWYIQINRTLQSAYQQRSKVVPGVIIPQKYRDPENASFWEALTGSYAGTDAQVRAARTLVRTYGLVPSLVSQATDSANNSYDNSCLAAKTEGGADLPIMEKLQCIINATFVPGELTALSREPSLDPMGVLVSAGGSILARSYELAVWGFGAQVTGGILSGIPFVGGIGAVAEQIGGMLITIAFIGFGAGVVLYFLLPIFPFMYFFFAVVAWVMEIFEAIVAMPLWALAHLRIHGDGMPGESAIQGYYLLLAIFLRPALIIFALLGSSLIFFGAIYLLQILFTPLLEITREDGLYGLETMIFTVIFAFIAYLLGISTFKMVDTVPNQILRWIGSGAQTFSDNREDPVGSSQTAFLGGAVIGQTLASNVGGVGSGLGRTAGSAARQAGSWWRSNRQPGGEDGDSTSGRGGPNQPLNPMGGDGLRNDGDTASNEGSQQDQSSFFGNQTMGNSKASSDNSPDIESEKQDKDTDKK